tara:strand:+ start:5695 stop:6750 length:1056 start_codon:yes stop_codon:yes gene_type:complete
MAFTPGELTNIANAALDYYFEKGKTFKNAVQAKPLVSAMEGKAKTFPGGKGEISIGIKGNYGADGTNDSLKGYTHDDTVAFYTPANMQRAAFPWRETHIGMTLTHTELKIDGISVNDTAGSKGTSAHSNREMTVLAGLLEDKTEDLGEQYLRGLNTMLWGDGTADAKGFAGIQSIIVDDPTAVGTVGGIDQVANVWWRNRANLAITSAATNGGAFMQVLQNECRQLRRYGSGPDLILAGSDAIDALEVEMRANGNYSDSGFSGGGDISVGDLSLKGVGRIKYDPTLDDMSMSKRLYMIDTKRVFLEKMESEWRRNHTPARPSDQFLVHRSITSTGQVVCSQRNTSGVYEIT